MPARPVGDLADYGRGFASVRQLVQQLIRPLRRAGDQQTSGRLGIGEHQPGRLVHFALVGDERLGVGEVAPGAAGDMPQ